MERMIETRVGYNIAMQYNTIQYITVPFNTTQCNVR
jgi:hypothetical protein